MTRGGRRLLIGIGLGAAVAVGGAAATFRFYRYPSSSMAPTLVTGQHLLVNRLAYRFGGVPRRGDVVVYACPDSPDKDFVKRVVAVAGDTVRIDAGRVVIDGKPVARSPVPGHCTYDDADEAGTPRPRACLRFEEQLGERRYHVIQDPAPGNSEARAPVNVPAGHVYVLGDNRDNSVDSRMHGPVPLATIRGRVVQ